MPSSSINSIETVLNIVRKINPQRVLDIGIGFGKYGFLLREYLELWDGRNVYNDWKRTIDGIEIHSPYVTLLQDMIYDSIYEDDALTVLDELYNTKEKYDLILLIDVIEHFNKSDGEKLINKCKLNSKNIIVVTPKVVSNQGVVFDNMNETHLSQWTEDEFDSPKTKYYYNQSAIIVHLEVN